MPWWSILLLAIAGFLVAVAIYDVLQKRHAILHNFPVIGHLRYITELFGPELRQYIVADNDEERPFSRDQRRWVYATSKQENPYFGFGTDNDVEAPGQIIIGHSAFPVLGGDHRDPLPAAKVLGGWRQRPGAFRPASVVNISGMSFGSLSGPAVRALNEGPATAAASTTPARAGSPTTTATVASWCTRSAPATSAAATRPAGSPWTACSRPWPVPRSGPSSSSSAREPNPASAACCPRPRSRPRSPPPAGCRWAWPYRARPGIAPSTTSPASSSSSSGSPTPPGCRLGSSRQWASRASGPSWPTTWPTPGGARTFVTIDGGEGGTGAGPAVFTDHVAYAFRQAMAKAYAPFVGAGLHQRVVFIGAGKLGYPETALAAFTLGCDMVNVGREAMLAIGCVQAQRCHTGHCPTGVATQNRWLTRGLDPTSKGVRAGNYVTALRRELLRLAHAAGVVHPALVPATAVEIVTENGATVPVADHYGLGTDIERLGGADTGALVGLMGEVAGA